MTRNFHSRFGEIDLIVTKGKELVFVEVKTRTSTLFGSPVESVTQAKLAKLIKTVDIFLEEHPQPGKQIRIDVIAILIQDGSPQIEHLEGVG